MGISDLDQKLLMGLCHPPRGHVYWLICHISHTIKQQRKSGIRDRAHFITNSVSTVFQANSGLISWRDKLRSPQIFEIFIKGDIIKLE